MLDPEKFRELIWEVALTITDAGYSLHKISDEFQVYQARPIEEAWEKTMPRFIMAMRSKTEASFRNISQEYEFGIDVPDMQYYITIQDAFPEAPFYIVFPVINAGKIWFGELDEIHMKSRFWRGGVKFHAGIFFVEVKSLREWKRAEALEMLNKLRIGVKDGSKS